MKTLNIGFVCLGLIGGSIAKALKKKRNGYTGEGRAEKTKRHR